MRLIAPAMLPLASSEAERRPEPGGSIVIAGPHPHAEPVAEGGDRRYRRRLPQSPGSGQGFEFGAHDVRLSCIQGRQVPAAQKQYLPPARPWHSTAARVLYRAGVPRDQMRKLLFLLAAGLVIARPVYAEPDGAAKRSAAALRRFGILNVALSVDCSIGLEKGGQRWIYRASPGEQSVLIMRTPKGETRWPILMARLTADKTLRILLASPYAGRPWEIILHRLPDGTYQTFRSAPLGNRHILSIDNGIYVENHRPTPPIQRCRE